MTTLDRADMAANDSTLALHTKNRASAISRLEATEAEIAELRRQIEAAAFDEEKAAEMVAAGNFDFPKSADLTTQGGTLSRLESAAAAIRLGIDKIDDAITKRNAELDREFLQRANEVRAQRMSTQFDALILLAELANADMELIKAAPGQVANSIGAAHFKFWRAVGFGATGARATAREYLDELAKEYGQRFGFSMTSKQAARVAALGI